MFTKMAGIHDTITLHSHPHIVRSIVKKTNAQHWKEIQVGDQIIISLDLSKHRYYQRGGWVPYYNIVVPERGLKFKDSHNSMMNRLENFVLESYEVENRGLLNLF